jgi:uncharacterized protein YbgA (DUF1722 family)
VQRGNEFTFERRRARPGPFRRPSAVNVLLHAFSHLSERLSPVEKAYSLDLLSYYRERVASLSSPVGVLRALVIRFDRYYLANQALVFPHPEPLASLLDSEKGEGRLRCESATRAST